MSEWMPLSKLFDWDAPDELGIYPFEARCLAVDWQPGKHPELLELGKPTIDFVFGRSNRVSRQIKYGYVVLYMPERWLSVHEKLALMQSLCDLHEDYPLKRVDIITSEPIIVSDFPHDMVRLMRDEDDRSNRL